MRSVSQIGHLSQMNSYSLIVRSMPRSLLNPIPIIIQFFFLSSGYAEETKWIAVGDLHNWFSEAGCEIEVGRTGQIDDQQDGLRWPAFYSVQDNQAAKAMWLGCTGFYDPIVDKDYEHKVVHVGPRFIDVNNETMPIEFTLKGKYDHTRVYVDGDPATDLNYLDIVDEIDANLISDRLLINRVQMSMGIHMTRKIYAYTHQDHQNYYIFEYIFTNNGCYDPECSTQYEQTINDFMAYFQYRYAISREGMVYDGNWLPQSAAWGHNTMNEVIGEHPGSPADSIDQFFDDGEIMRAMFSWHGYHAGAAFDNIGGPNAPGDGHLGASQFAGVVTLHADKSATDNSDDLGQPSTTWFMLSDDPLTDAGSDQYNASRMTDEYQYMTQGHPEKNQAQQVGTGNANSFSPGGQSNPGGTSQGLGYGPYDLQPGDSVRIVYAEAVAGLSRKKAYEVGINWNNDMHTDQFPPNVSLAQKYMMNRYSRTGSGSDGYKNAWVYTGVDSLIQTFKRARKTYNDLFVTPETPPPPTDFNIVSGGDRISISWANNAEDWPTFNGYRLTRLKFKPDTTVFVYDLENGEIIEQDESIAYVWEFGPGQTSYDDLSANRGFDYYYFLEVLDDGSQNNGVPLKSSKFFTITNSPAFLKRPPGMLEEIRVVPNPYNIASRDMQYGVSAPDRLMFLNIPGECTIRIFTERGDLLKTIQHTDGSGDEAWNSITSSRQVITSGLYIAHFETPEGENAIRKFIVVR